MMSIQELTLNSDAGNQAIINNKVRGTISNIKNGVEVTTKMQGIGSKVGGLGPHVSGNVGNQISPSN